jgi:hypothetical protein
MMAGKEKMWPHGVICGATGGPSEMGHTTSSSGDCTSTCVASPQYHGTYSRPFVLLS